MMPMSMMPTRNSSGGSQVNGSMLYGFHSTAIPMHQPRPQKQLSIADIESPASFSFKPPQQQHEQPFHQQMPAYAGADDVQQHVMGAASAPGGTPLSHIPEGAVYANPFQPYPMMQPPAMYGMPYYPVMPDGMQYAAPMPGMPLYQPYMSVPLPQQQAMSPQQADVLAHEANGMMYYSGATAQSDGHMPQQQYAQNMMGPPVMMNPQAPYYYPPAPPAMFYPSQPA